MGSQLSNHSGSYLSAEEVQGIRVPVEQDYSKMPEKAPLSVTHRQGPGDNVNFKKKSVEQHFRSENSMDK